MIAWVPPVNEAIENVATPDPFSVPLPSVVAPSRNVTVPVGVPPVPVWVAVAVNVTFAPNVDGFGEAARVTVS